MNIPQDFRFAVHAAPSVSFGILIVPLFDTMRVFLIRILNGRSPFRADRNHVHHRLLAMGMSHIKATSWILFANVLFIAMVVSLNYWGIIDLMFLNLTVAIFFSFIPEIVFKLKKHKYLSK
jgi:UDP-GlcNAc:undecaprenyl-phosphate GlcNAc-1-phosphate transferase